MVITKTNPAGIDREIQAMQVKLYDYLKSKWGLTDSDYQCYGRCYKNKKENGYIAETYMGNGEYREAFLDDSLKVSSFFSLSDKVDNNIWKGMTNMALIFFVNIDRVKSLGHRGDEEVRLDVLSFFDGSRDMGTGFAELQNIETGLSNVLREYNKDNLSKADLHPFHAFRINFSIQQKFF